MVEDKHLMELDIVRRCLKGDKSSQKSLYHLHAKKMMGVCLGYSNSRDEAKDILQEGYIKVFASLNKFKGEGSLEGWIRRIIVHTAVDYYRKNLKNLKNVPVSNAKMMTDHITTLDIIQEKELLELIQKLPEGARIIFNLYAVEGYKHEEIAELLDISCGTSKSQFSRARELLKRWLGTFYQVTNNKTESVQNIS